jgi:hypothetical protein
MSYYYLLLLLLLLLFNIWQSNVFDILYNHHVLLIPLRKSKTRI